MWRPMSVHRTSCFFFPVVKIWSTCKMFWTKRRITETMDLPGISYLHHQQKLASFWEKTNANVKCSGTYEWTSLIGSDKTSLMELLQTQLEQIKWHHLPRNQATSDKALVRFSSTFQNHESLWTQSWTAASRCPKWKRIHQPVYSSL